MNNMAQWLSWLERRPVTAEVESSSLFWVVLWGLSSAGRASALQAEGHRFEPYRPHTICRSGGTGRRPGLKIPWVVIPVPVRFRSAAVLKSRGNVVKWTFPLFFCFYSLNASAHTGCWQRPFLPKKPHVNQTFTWGFDSASLYQSVQKHANRIIIAEVVSSALCKVCKRCKVCRHRIIR